MAGCVAAGKTEAEVKFHFEAIRADGEPLKDTGFFRRVAVNPETGTIEWPNGADFAPEFLHEIGRAVHQVA